MQHEEGGDLIDAIAFNVDLKLWPNARSRFLHAAYRLDINEYQGRTKLQLVVVDMQTAHCSTVKNDPSSLTEKSLEMNVVF